MQASTEKGRRPMPDIEYTAISDAIANAPAPPRAAIWDTAITGPAARRHSVISGYIAHAAAGQVQVELFASPDALQSANLAGKDELNGARIVQGAAPALAFDQYRFKFCR